MSGHEIGQRIDRFLNAEGSAIAALHDYYRSGHFTGRYFDTYGGGGLAEPNRVTAEDVVALSFLGVPVGHGAAERLVADAEPEFGRLLERLQPSGRSAWDVPYWSLWDDDGVDELLALDGPARALWALAESLPGFGETRSNKLLARKRPHLFPVWDEVVQTALSPPIRNFWIPLRSALRENDNARVTRLLEIRQKAGLSEHISPLRVLDVIVWVQSR